MQIPKRWVSRGGWARVLAFSLVAACSDAPVGQTDSSPTVPVLDAPFKGAWLAAREGHPLHGPAALATLARMRAAGVTHVAIGPEVTMPRLAEPKLRWGDGDAELRTVLRAIRAAGMRAFLLPRIESPDFFEPPYPFRADIRFESADDWERFHRDLQRVIEHYAVLAEAERVALFGLGLELKHSVREHPQRWRQIIAAARQKFSGPLTYSANWYDEWEDIEFWDALDYIGVGAYFELKAGSGEPRPESGAGLAQRWVPIQARLARVAQRAGRPVLFTEVGYTGYRDCVERPWEWAGKQERGAPIDHHRQARAWEALLRAFAQRDDFAGLFAWTWYTTTDGVADWEYAIEGRPAAGVLRAAFGRRTPKRAK